MTQVDVSEMVGKTFTSVKVNKDKTEVKFVGSVRYHMNHRQDCCECVWLEDIVGDLDDLVGVPILLAEARTNVEDSPPESEVEYYNGSHTWTFYTFRTHKGTVTLRWYGESNGYYGEEVEVFRA